MTDETIFRPLAAAFIVAAFSISFYFRRKADLAGGKISRRVDPRRVLILQKLVGIPFFLSLIAYLVEPAWMSWSQLEIPAGVRWSGLPIALLALIGLPWMFGHLGANITPTAAARREAQLVTSGPYRYIRHPLYTFGSLFWLGLGLIMASWLVLLFAVLAFSLMTWRTSREEAALVEKFGDEYRRYMARTPRYLPWPRAPHSRAAS